MQTLLLWLQDNPAAVSGFLGGIVGALLVHFIHWRWRIVRRDHPPDDS